LELRGVTKLKDVYNLQSKIFSIPFLCNSLKINKFITALKLLKNKYLVIVLAGL